MKKTYEKPRLVALSLSGNDLLCSTCTFDIIGDNADQGLVGLIETGFGVDITISSFSNEDGCATAIPGIEDTGYCKFNGADNMTVFNS